MSVDRAPSGAGVGPDDPDYVAAKALRTLEAADITLVSSIEARTNGTSRVEEIVYAHLPAKIGVTRRIPFSMVERRDIGQHWADAWEAPAAAAVEALKTGMKWVVSVTVGDVSVFSTFPCLCDLVLQRVEVKVEVIPEVTTMQAIVVVSRIPLVEGQEILFLMPWTVGPETLARACEVSDAVVIYKGGCEMTELRAVLDTQGRLGRVILDTDLRLPSEHLVFLSEVTDRTPYFSTVLAAPKRSITGGRT